MDFLMVIYVLRKYIFIYHRIKVVSLLKML